MSLICDLCGSTDFVKDQGLFVCQGCGCKYTVAEAREIMAREQERERRGHAARVSRHDPDAQARRTAAPKPAADPKLAAQPEPAPAPEPPRRGIDLRTATDFSQAIGGSLQGAQAVNNYACQGWQMLLDEYERLDHPSKARQQELGERAREVLMLLDNAARIEPENHVQDLLILQNCKEVVSSAHATDYFEKDDEGKWRRRSFALDVKLPGQSRSWDDLIAFHRGFIEQRYRDGHPDEERERAALLAQRDEIQGRLDALKDEKRSHGFFDFAGKREVKDRMRPVKEELSQIGRQLSSLDGNVDAYVEKRLGELESGYIRLDL